MVDFQQTWVGSSWFLSNNYNNLIAVPWWTSSRLGLAVLGFFGFINVYALRVNMSVAIVCMVNKTAIQTNSSKQQSQQSDIGCGLVSATSNTSETFTFDVCIW